MRDSQFWPSIVWLRGSTTLYCVLAKHTARHPKVVQCHTKPPPGLKQKLPTVHSIIFTPKCDCYQFKGWKIPKLLFSLVFLQIFVSQLWHPEPLSDQFSHKLPPEDTVDTKLKQHLSSSSLSTLYSYHRTPFAHQIINFQVFLEKLERPCEFEKRTVVIEW